MREALLRRRAAAVALGDWNVVREIDLGLSRYGWLPEVPEVVVPDRLERAVPVKPAKIDKRSA